MSTGVILMGDWCGSVNGRERNTKEVTGTERESEEFELASGRHPAKRKGSDLLLTLTARESLAPEKLDLISLSGRPANEFLAPLDNAVYQFSPKTSLLDRRIRQVSGLKTD